MRLPSNTSRGFTLVETLVYVAIFCLFVGSIITFIQVLSTVRTRNQALLEVQNQGSTALSILTHAIRNASAISGPVVGASGTTLTLATVNPSTNPTVFTVGGGVLTMKEGAAEPVALTTNKVSVQNSIFSNVSRPQTFGAVQIRLDVVNAVIGSRSYGYNSVFYGSATIRK